MIYYIPKIIDAKGPYIFPSVHSDPDIKKT